MLGSTSILSVNEK
jgi:hypothetical protein